MTRLLGGRVDETTIDLAALEPAEDDPHTLAVQGLNAELIRFQRLIHAMKLRMVRIGPEGVDPGALAVLMMLMRSGPARQADLASSAMLDPSTVSRHVRQLVERGLVERRPDPGDGRAVLLAPTEAGNAAFEGFKAERTALMTRILAGWAAEDVESLRHLLSRLVDDASSERALDLR